MASTGQAHFSGESQQGPSGPATQDLYHQCGSISGGRQGRGGEFHSLVTPPLANVPLVKDPGSQLCPSHPLLLTLAQLQTSPYRHPNIQNISDSDIYFGTKVQQNELKEKKEGQKELDTAS